MTAIQKRLIGSNESPYNGRVYYVSNNQKRWIPSKECLESYGFTWPDDVSWVSSDELDQYTLASPIPMPYSINDMFNLKDISVVQMREIISSELSGQGIEFGAAASPFPVPIDCHVQYADILPEDLLTERLYPGQSAEFVHTSIIASLENMKVIEDSSLDFIIACHVIEHVHNPLLALEQAWYKLKTRGTLLLVVPHKDFTFDKNRELTSLDHIILDYKHPNIERDILHYLEFYSKSYVTPIENIYEVIIDNIKNKDGYIHYHTWNESTFNDMLQHFNSSILPWASIKLTPKIEHPDANEFYCLLTK